MPLRARCTRLAALLVLPSALLAGGCIPLVGDGDLEVREREVSGFDAVVNDTALDVEVTLGAAESVRVMCDANLLDRVETAVRDGVLHIGRAGLLPLRPRAGCRVEVDAEHLRALRNSGSGDLRTIGVATELVDIRQKGSGSITVDELQVAHLEVRATGSGSVDLAGQSDDVAYINTGSGTIHARELTAATALARSTGSGGLDLHASELVDAELLGSGDIHVWGSPADRHARTTGSGAVVFH